MWENQGRPVHLHPLARHLLALRTHQVSPTLSATTLPPWHHQVLNGKGPQPLKDWPSPDLLVLPQLQLSGRARPPASGSPVLSGCASPEPPSGPVNAVPSGLRLETGWSAGTGEEASPSSADAMPCTPGWLSTRQQQLAPFPWGPQTPATWALDLQPGPPSRGDAKASATLPVMRGPFPGNPLEPHARDPAQPRPPSSSPIGRSVSIKAPDC